MSSRELLLEGVELMLVGTGLVFLFLVLLIVCIRLMSAVISRWTPADAPVAAAALPLRKSPAGSLPDADTLKAIEEVIRQHRARF